MWLCKYNTQEQCNGGMDCVNCILNKVRQEIKSHTTYGGHDSDYWFNHGLDVSLKVVDKYLFNKHIQEEEEEQEPIKALGEELRKVRGGISDEKVLVGFNMAVAICNKHLAESENKK